MAIEEDISTLQEEVGRLKLQVRSDKLRDDWASSKTRAVYVSVTTYTVAYFLMVGLGIQRPFINALVPTILYMFTFQSLPFLRSFWIKQRLVSEKKKKEILEEKQGEVADIIQDAASRA